MRHYHYGSGSHGCMYDFGPGYARTIGEAVESLDCVFDFTADRRETLRHDRYVELDPAEDGASYCEITTCTDSCDPSDYEA